MAIAKELLERLNNNDLAVECDKASVYAKILTASWDGLNNDEIEALRAPLRATMVSDEDVTKIFEEQLELIRKGEDVETILLGKISEIVGRISDEACRSAICHAIFDEAVAMLSLDKQLSNQEKEVIREELAPRLSITKEEAEAALAKVASQLDAEKAKA